MDIQRQRIYRGCRSPYSAQVLPQMQSPCCVPPMASPKRESEGGGCAYPSLAMVYAPDQPFAPIYTPEKALHRGTLFEGLDLPFAAGKRC